MTRYAGERIGPKANIAVVANDSLGNFVVCTPLLQMLRDKFPDAAIALYSGQRVAELAEGNDLFDDFWPLFGSSIAAFVDKAQNQPPYALVINVESSPVAAVAASVLGQHGFVSGPCLTQDNRSPLPFTDTRGPLWADESWTAEDLPARYPFLGSGFIAEIFCRLAYLDGPLPRYRVPFSRAPVGMPEVLISMAASLAEKLWSYEGWSETIRRLRSEGLAVGLLGAKSADQRRYWQGDAVEERLIQAGLCKDFRGALTLPQVADALSRAHLVLTLDNGILHLAAASDVPIVGLFRHGVHRLWAPRVPNLHVLTPEPGSPVTEIDPDTVWMAARQALNNPLPVGG